MTEEEYFRKTYPDSCYGDRPLSPHFDFFQDGVEFGERESEEKIAELEQKLEQTEKDLTDYQFNYPTIKELQKEIEELKKTYRKQRNKRIDELQKENAELKSEKGCETCTKFDEVQLTKAKEIIENLLGVLPDEVLHHDYYKRKYVDPAEQFLKENE